MTILDAADGLGKEIKAKREIKKEAGKLAEQAKADALKEQQRHEEAKRRGML